MKYKLIYAIVLSEEVIDKHTYSVGIELYIHPTDNIASDFIKTITVVSTNSSNGYEVDEQRESEVNRYISSINK